MPSILFFFLFFFLCCSIPVFSSSYYFCSIQTCRSCSMIQAASIGAAWEQKTWTSVTDRSSSWTTTTTWTSVARRILWTVWTYMTTTTYIKLNCCCCCDCWCMTSNLYHCWIHSLPSFIGMNTLLQCNTAALLIPIKYLFQRNSSRTTLYDFITHLQT